MRVRKCQAVNEAESHELISALKDAYLNKGSTPSRKEFEKLIRGGERKIDVFGGYIALCHAAGVEAYGEKRVKITNAVFSVKDIQTHVASHEPPTLLLQEPYPSIMSISDIHWPFEMEAVVNRFIARVEVKKPEFIILNGDAFDMYSAAKFPRSHNVFTPKDEERLARDKNADFWKRVKAASPDSKCFQMLGNHDLRPLKRVLEQVPAIEHWAQAYMKDLFSFDGVTTVHDDRQELKIGNVLALHGYYSGIGKHRDFTRANCMVGHTHRGGVVFRNAYDVQTNSQRVIWELNSGYAGNPMAKGLTYTPQKITDWTWGWSEVDSEGPRFVAA